MEKPHPTYEMLKTSGLGIIHDRRSCVSGYKAANDNHLTAPSQSGLDNMVTIAALRLFAEHGLSSADHAVANAKRCFWSADSHGHKWWMAISHQIDSNIVSLPLEQDDVRPTFVKAMPHMVHIAE